MENDGGQTDEGSRLGYTYKSKTSWTSLIPELLLCRLSRQGMTWKQWGCQQKWLCIAPFSHSSVVGHGHCDLGSSSIVGVQSREQRDEKQHLECPMDLRLDDLDEGRC